MKVIAGSERLKRLVEVRRELLDNLEKRLIGNDPDGDVRGRPGRNECLLRRPRDVYFVNAESRLSPAEPKVV